MPKKALLAGVTKSHRSTIDQEETVPVQQGRNEQGVLAGSYSDIAMLNQHAKLRSVSRGHRANDMLLIDAEKYSPKTRIENRPAGKTILENMK